MTESENFTERVHFLMSKTQKELLDSESKRTGVSQGEIMRNAFLLWCATPEEHESRD